jgi:hypothetical protein
MVRPVIAVNMEPINMFWNSSPKSELKSSFTSASKIFYISPKKNIIATITVPM